MLGHRTLFVNLAFVPANIQDEFGEAEAILTHGGLRGLRLHRPPFTHVPKMVWNGHIVVQAVICKRQSHKRGSTRYLTAKPALG